MSTRKHGIHVQYLYDTPTLSVMYFDQLLRAARKVHAVSFDQLLGAAHYTHFIPNHDSIGGIHYFVVLLQRRHNNDIIGVCRSIKFMPIF